MAAKYKSIEDCHPFMQVMAGIGVFVFIAVCCLAVSTMVYTVYTANQPALSGTVISAPNGVIRLGGGQCYSFDGFQYTLESCPTR